MKRAYMLILLVMICGTARAQLSPPQKLYYLCKVWGYLKYHHPDNCSVKWNDLLLEKADSVAASSGNADFQAILYRMCLQTGLTARPGMPQVIAGDTAKNYQTAWFRDGALGGPVQAFLDSVHAHRRPNTSGCLMKVNNYSDPNFISYIDFRADSIRNIPGFTYTKLGHRMLVYFYYWNAINYLFPQIQIADQSWDSTLSEVMPDMITAAGDSAFELTLARAQSRIDDAHGVFNGRYYLKFLTGADPASQAIYRSRLNIAWVENQHVITASGEPGIFLGDIITRIDGTTADSFFARWKPYISAGNEVTRLRNMYRFLQYGPLNGVRHLELKDASNRLRQVDLNIGATLAQYALWNTNNVDTLPEWDFARCQYGYVHMGKLTRSNISAMYTNLLHQPGIVFDVRNYPQGTIFDLKRLFLPAPNISAQYFVPDLESPGYYHTRNDLNSFGSWNNNSPYSGKVIILVNEETQSHAEYTAQILRTFPKAVVIGSQTAGADGNISYLELPNGIRVYWSSLGWYEADWYNPQRAGVRVDSVVRRTIAGVRSGRDEVLEKAFSCRLDVSAVSAGAVYTVLRQEGQVTIRSSGGLPFSLDLINMQGQRVYRSTDHNVQTIVPTGSYVPGMYVMRITDQQGGGKRLQLSVH